MVHFESGIERKKRGFGKENILSSHISDFQIPRGIQWSEVQRSEIRFLGDSKSFVRPNFVTDKKNYFRIFTSITREGERIIWGLLVIKPQNGI